MSKKITLLLGVLLAVSFIPLFSLAQEVVRGHVLSRLDQSPVVGATVTIKGTRIGTSTGIDGGFAIKAPNAAILVISGIGLETKEVAVTGNDLTVIVAANSKELNQVVVTALGIRKEAKRIGYSVQEVKGDDLLKAREANPIGGLAGKVAGLNVGINQELLGAPLINLRGNSVNLFVVDGIPINTDLWNISPDDVESFTVLKSPAAAALYGNRGINGAILITTKRAKKNARGFTVEVNSTNQFNRGFITIPKVQNIYGGGDDNTYAFGDGNGGGVNDADYDVWGTKMDGRLLPQYDGPVDPTQSYTTVFQDGSKYIGHIKPTPYVVRGPNNLNGFIRTGVLSTNNVSFSSVTEKSNIRMSVTNTYQTGIVPNTKLNTTNFNMFASSQLSSKFKIEGNLNYNRQSSPNVPDVDYGPNSIIYNIDIWTGADWNINAMKNYWQPGEAGLKSIFIEYKRYQNPWFMSYEWLRSHAKNDLYGWVAASYKINDRLEATLRTNVTTYGIFRTEKLPFSAHPYGEEFGGGHGEYREDHRDLWENNTDLLLKFNAPIAKSGITISGLAGGTARTMKYNSNFTTTTYLTVPNVYNFSNTLDPIRSWNYAANMIVLSGYYSLDINFNKYLTLSTTGRVDKSSALPSSANTYFYPSVSLSSVISDYVQMPEPISFVKVRGSYANVKDGNLINYIGTAPSVGYPLGYGVDYQSPYNGPDFTPKSTLTSAYTTTPIYNNTTGASTPTNGVDPKLKPYNRTNYEAGFDVRFLKNRLGLSGTYFKYIDGPKIVGVPVSQASGLTTFTTNANKIDRSGYELSIQGTPIQQSKGLTWDVLINLGTYKEVYKELAPGSQSRTAQPGMRTDIIWDAKEAMTPDGKLIHDSSGKALHLPVVQNLGHSDPDLTWGITNTFGYHGFSFSFQFDGAIGGKVEDYVRKKLFQGGRHEETATGIIGAARAYEAANWGNAGYTGAYAGGKPMLGGDGVQVSNNVPISYDPVTGQITNFKQLNFAPNQKAIHYIQDYVDNVYDDPEHIMVSRTYAKLRQVVIGYSLPPSLLSKTFIQKVEISLVGRNLLYFFHKGFKDIDIDQYPGRDLSNSTQQSSGLQTPTTRSYGVNLNIVF